MRPRRVVAGTALIALLASVGVPAVAGIHPSGPEQTISDEAFAPVVVARDRETSMTILLDPMDKSASPLSIDGEIRDPVASAASEPRPTDAVPTTKPVVVKIVLPSKPTKPATSSVSGSGSWRHDPELSWYGPGFFGQHTACGQILTKTLLGVANRTLPCGTLITFKWGSRVVTVPVVDRGPYVSGRQWDLTYATCLALNHCFTGPIYWRYG